MISKKPNIVLVVMDTVRAKNLPMYGYKKNTMPFLNELSKKSVVYKNAYSNAPWTLPSHASLFTGLHSSNHGIISISDKLGKQKNLVKQLHKKGYYTLGFSHNQWIAPFFNFDLGFDEFVFERDRDWLNSKKAEDQNQALRLIKFFIHLVKKGEIKRFLRFLRNKFLKKIAFNDKGATITNKKLNDKLKYLKDPFFIFINYLEAHTPYSAPKKIKQKFLGNKKIISSVGLKKDVDFQKVDLDVLNSSYDSGLYYLDTKLREMYDLFKKNGLLENTIFIFTSDHGEYLGEHKLFEHNIDIYPEVIKIPLIIKYPSEKTRTYNSNFDLISLNKLILNDFKDTKTNEKCFSEFFGLRTTRVHPEEKPCIKKEYVDRGKTYKASVISKKSQLIVREDGSIDVVSLSPKIKKDEINIPKLKKEIIKIFGNIKNKRLDYWNKKNSKREVRHKIKMLKNKIKDTKQSTLSK